MTVARLSLARAVALAALGAFSLCACSSSDGGASPFGTQKAHAASPRFSSVLLKNVPHVKQKPDFCGEACAEMGLRRLGHRIDQDAVFGLTGLSPTLGRGAYTVELKRALSRLGFKVGRVWHHIEPARAAAGMLAQLAAVHRDLKRGVPSILCMRYDTSPNTTEHFRLIVGFDAKRDEVIYHDPAVRGGKYLRMKRAMLFKLWPLKYKRSRWLLIRIPLDATARAIRKPVRRRRASRFSAADYAQHVMKLKKRLPKGFHIVHEPPFVVVGNEPRARVAARARSTVRWAVSRLKRAYFKKDPEHILDVWLFKDRASYRSHVRRMFGSNPGTPYGFYSSSKRALIMNISTGGGTLVHEIVHPFIEANFPKAPPWLNEGLGSLYEQSASRGGRIVGLTNWRLAGLQRAIRAGRVPSLRTLTSRTTNQFYNADPGTNYAQSRYLLYYLQQTKRLRRFYHAFYKARRSDPTGYKTLVRVLGTRNVKAFEASWKRWVLTLRYP